MTDAPAGTRRTPAISLLLGVLLLAAGGVVVFTVQSLLEQVRTASREGGGMPASRAGMLAIHKAASKGDAAAVAAEVSGGADPNAAIVGEPGRQGMTPLMCAAFEGNAETITTLLNAKARAETRSADGRTALMYAAGWGDAARLRAILEHPVMQSPESDKAAIVNARADGGWTALMYASARGSVDSVRALVAAGAEVDARNKWRQTALMHAARAGDVGKVSALIEAGASIRLMDSDNNSVVAIAASVECDPAILAALFAAGADLNAADFEGVTPLMKAAHRADAAQVRALLEHRADAAAKDGKGWTAKDWAASRADELGRAVVAMLETPGGN